MVGPEIDLEDVPLQAGAGVGPRGPRGPRGYTGPAGDPGVVFEGLAEGEVPTADGDGGFVARPAVYSDEAGALRYASDGSLVPVVSGSDAERVKAGSVDPADVGYDVVLLIGQSNMQGTNAEWDARTDPQDPRVWQFGTLGTYKDVISAAIDPLAHPATYPNSVGPGVPYGRQRVRSTPENRKVLLVPCAFGGTDFVFSGRNWSVDTPPGSASLYHQAVDQARKALAAAGANSRLISILWCQGESSVEESARYQADLDALINQIRVDLPADPLLGLPHVPFQLLQMVPENIETNPDLTAERQLINRIHIDTPRRHQVCSFTYGARGHVFALLPSHYTAAGQRINGAQLYRDRALALGNLTGTAPVAPAAPTVKQAGTTLNVSWAHPGGRVTDYHVRWRLQGAGSWTALTRTQSVDLAAAITGTTNGQTYEVQAQTENEQGLSAWSPTTTIATVTAPAAAGALTVGTLTASSAALTATSVARATAYRYEYKKSADPTWVPFVTLSPPTADLLHATILALTSETAYDFRYVPVNAAGEGAPSTPVTGTTLPLPGILDVVTAPAYRATSISRRLSTSYSGQCIRVRRSSDNTEQDIGFSGSDVNKAAMTTFAGGGSLYLAKIYDQSGNGRHWVQATAAAQPRVMNAGVFEVINTRVAAFGDGTDDHMSDTAAGLYAAGAATVLAVLSGSSAVNNARLLVEANTADTGEYALLAAGGTTAKQSTLLVNDEGTTVVNIATANSNGVMYTGTPHVVTLVDSGSRLERRIDGIDNFNTFWDYTRAGTLGANKVALWGKPTAAGVAAPTAATVAEVVMWPVALSAEDRAAIEANAKAYFLTP